MMEYQLFKRYLPGVLAAAVLLIGVAESFGQNRSGMANRNSTVLAQGMTNAQGEEIVGKVSGFSAVIVLDDSKLDTLMKRGQFEVSVPPQLVNNIESVIVKRPVYFKDRVASGFADAELNGTKLLVQVDNKVIDRIDYQPVELKVYEAGFSSIVLKYVGVSSDQTEISSLGDATVDSPDLTVYLDSGKAISGKIRGMKTMALESTLGPIDVALSKTRLVRVNEGGKLGIEMLNGDRISGSVKFKEIELLNRWDDETIPLDTIESLVVRQPKQYKSLGKEMRVLPSIRPVTQGEYSVFAGAN